MILPDQETKKSGRERWVGMRLYKAYYKFAEDYLWMHGYAQSTADNYRWAISSFIKAVGDVPLDQITQDHIKQWRKYMDQHQYEIGAINAFLYRLRKLLNYYSTKTALAINPDEIIIPKKKKPIPKYLTKKEIDKMIEASDTREKAIISMLYSSGVRVGELTKIRLKDLAGETIKVRGKGGKERIVFIDFTALKHLNEYLRTRDDTCQFLFYSRKCNGLKVGRIQQLIRSAGKKANINKPVSPHILRHSYATHMVQNGIGGFHLQQLLGHADISTTQIYVHLGSSDLRKAYKQFHNA